MKTYLYPTILRRASPIITAVEKRHGVHWLVTYSELNRPKRFTKKFKGLGKEYSRSSASRISPAFYNAFIKESISNRVKFRSGDYE